MFALTRQEQWIVAFVMLALAVGTLVRVCRQAGPLPVATGSPIQTTQPPAAETDSHGEDNR
jgi:hypothetical protein